MPDSDRRRGAASVGESPLILGYAGLLPQVAAVATCFFGGSSDIGPMFAFGYATLILSFLGGIWWGLAMSAREAQGRIACWAVIPSLFAAAVILLSIGHVLAMGWALVLLGCAVMLTLLADRRLVEAHVAPDGWMALRVPLSIGLGALTILCGILCGLQGS
jgi:uncharacterized membrane protein